MSDATKNMQAIFSKPFVFMSAPLEDNSDEAYRTLSYRHGADLTFTEMTRLKGLLAHNKSTWEKISINSQTPTQIQLLAGSAKELEEFLQIFKPHAGFMGFNFNMGCPSPQIIKLGLGCASVKRIQRAKDLVAVCKKYKYPVSIKIRLGMNQYEKEKKVYLNLLREVDADFFIVHARHGRQHYEEKADMSIYEACVKTGKIIIANGDIDSDEKISFLKRIGVRGAMIARSACYNPAIFEQLQGQTPVDASVLREEYLQLAQQFGSKQKYVENLLCRIGKVKSDTMHQG